MLSSSAEGNPWLALEVDLKWLAIASILPNFRYIAGSIINLMLIESALDSSANICAFLLIDPATKPVSMSSSYKVKTTFPWPESKARYLRQGSQS